MARSITEGWSHDGSSGGKSVTEVHRGVTQGRIQENAMWKLLLLVHSNIWLINFNNELNF